LTQPCSLLSSLFHLLAHVRWLRGEEEVAAVGFTVTPQEVGLALVLQYTMVGTREKINLSIPLETTQPRFGGVRWWGRCPLSVNHIPCGRRIAKLYLPPRGKYFGCRSCHRLAYRSSQEHDKRADALRKNPARLDAILNDPRSASLADLSLALKATRVRGV
jgi:hypothetical protein